MKPNREIGTIRWLTPCFLILTLSAPPVSAADTSGQARAILAKMANATRAKNYDGTFVSIRGADTASMRIIHKADSRGEHERLIALTGTAKEVIRRNDEVICIFPNERSVMVEKTSQQAFFGTAWSQPIEQAAVLYDFSVLGGDRIAGRPAWVLGIRPKDADRYSYRLWVDTSSSLLLKSQVLDGGGSILEQLLFTALETPAVISESALQASISGEGYTWYRNETPQTSGERNAGWKVGWLPRGFAMTEQQMHDMPKDKKAVKHKVFSDGLATVSVFIEKNEEQAVPVQGYSAFGALNTYRTLADGYQITVVGEVPAATVRQIAVSVSPAAP
ncbi:MAG: MucB/RseB C-terminal domain-containing protein [Gammaproteobacteria bacterium]